MLVSLATLPGQASQPNEDFIAATDRAVVVLDGVSVPEGLDLGCFHGTPWYVRHLGTRLLMALTTQQGSLRELLAAAIGDTAALHADTCDLTHLGTPAATVAALRADSKLVEYLVLPDAFVVLDATAGLQALTDTRVEQTARQERAAALQLPTGTAKHAARRRALIESQRRYKNQPGGYWVAAAVPEAAEHALSGTFERGDVRRAALCTDGAARLVEFGLADWAGFLDDLEARGPSAVIQRVRRAEDTDAHGERWPRTKLHDDAAIALCQF